MATIEFSHGNDCISIAMQLSPWRLIYLHGSAIISMVIHIFPWQHQIFSHYIINVLHSGLVNTVSLATTKSPGSNPAQHCFYGNVCFVSIYACQYHWFFSLFFVSFCPWQPHILISNIKLPFITPMFTIATPTTPWHPLLHDNSNCLHDNMVSPIATPTSLWPPTQASNSHTHSKYLLLWWHILYQW